jgi:cardiolipin synthase A/B
MKSRASLANRTVREDDVDVESSTRYPWLQANVADHDLVFVFGGEERLQLLLDAIAAARRRIQMFFYAFAADSAGRLVTDALIEARNRGVSITLLVDGFGTGDPVRPLVDEMVEAGISFGWFQPRFGRRYLLRNHQKMLIIDEAVAIVGGSNIEAAYFADEPVGEGWHDVYVRVEGDAVSRLAAYHEALAAWIATPDAGIRSLVTLLARYSDADGPLRWLFGGPSRRLNQITRALRIGIVNARRVDMVQAYFSPNWGFLRKLGQVSRRGHFRLITAARSDNNTTIAAARHCYRRLLKRSAEIFEYQPQRLHMKLVVIDDVTYVGSANFDMRSLYLNTEIMLRIDDAALAGRLRDLIDTHLPHCHRVTRESHKAESTPLRRLRWLLGYLIVTALDYRLTRNLNWKAD